MQPPHCSGYSAIANLTRKSLHALRIITKNYTIVIVRFVGTIVLYIMTRRVFFRPCVTLNWLSALRSEFSKAAKKPGAFKAFLHVPTPSRAHSPYRYCHCTGVQPHRQSATELHASGKIFASKHANRMMQFKPNWGALQASWLQLLLGSRTYTKKGFGPTVAVQYAAKRYLASINGGYRPQSGRARPAACSVHKPKRRRLQGSIGTFAATIDLPVPEQGRRTENDRKIREYFYYIDHQGQLFLADAKHKNFTSCFKEQAFLNFFFKQLCANPDGKYIDLGFHFISLCGRERNYVRCDDMPFVVTEIAQNAESSPLVIFNYAKKLNSSFKPEMLFMSSSGRVYYPSLRWTQDEAGAGDTKSRMLSVALVKSALALELAPLFAYQYDDNDADAEPSDDRPPYSY